MMKRSDSVKDSAVDRVITAYECNAAAKNRLM